MNAAFQLLCVVLCVGAPFGQPPALQHVDGTIAADTVLVKRLMGLREEKTFTDDEITRAFEFILSPLEARKEAMALNAIPDYKGFAGASSEELNRIPVRGPRSYDGDFLDLMSLVSASCAERAWALMAVTTSEGVERRTAFLRRISPILRRTPDIPGI